MTNINLFFSISGTFIILLLAFYKMLTKYMDARFDTINSKFETVDAKFETVDVKFESLTKYLDTRFTSIDNKLDFLVNHLIQHGERIAALETHTGINKP